MLQFADAVITDQAVVEMKEVIRVRLDTLHLLITLSLHKLFGSIMKRDIREDTMWQIRHIVRIDGQSRAQLVCERIGKRIRKQADQEESLVCIQH